MLRRHGRPSFEKTNSNTALFGDLDDYCDCEWCRWASDNEEGSDEEAVSEDTTADCDSAYESDASYSDWD